MRCSVSKACADGTPPKQGCAKESFAVTTGKELRDRGDSRWLGQGQEGFGRVWKRIEQGFFFGV